MEGINNLYTRAQKYTFILEQREKYALELLANYFNCRTITIITSNGHWTVGGVGARVGQPPQPCNELAKQMRATIAYDRASPMIGRAQWSHRVSLKRMLAGGLARCNLIRTYGFA